jgi:hypothetical protein
LRAVLLKESDSNRNLRSAACRTRIHISGRYIYTSGEITFFIRALYTLKLFTLAFGGCKNDATPALPFNSLDVN